MRVCKVAIFAILAAGALIGEDRPAFDAASIKVNDSVGQSGILGPNPEGLTAQNVSVKFCIQMAWHLQDYQISIPAALRDSADSPHYDIVARAGGPVPPDTLMLMFQSLLTERFHLAVHFEKQDLPVFALVVAKGGPKQLHDPAPGSVAHMEPGSDNPASRRRWAFYNEPVGALAGLISNGLSRPLIDMTGIKGTYDFAFDLPTWNRAEGPLGDHVVADVFPEVQSQLGLRVEAQTAPVDVLVIDHIDKIATAN
jgi:uncharacterized protein (TIGR03435 family)